MHQLPKIFATMEIMHARNSNETRSLDMTIAKLKDICRHRAFERALGIGRLVIAEVYQDDLALWTRKQTRFKPFRALATHEELPLSPSDLYRCVAIYEIVMRHDARSVWPHLTVSHFRGVIGLAVADQARLLQRASEQRWSVARLAREANMIRASSPERRGRPAVIGGAKLLQQMVRLARTGLKLHDPTGDLAELDAEALHELGQALVMVQASCSRLKSHIESHLGQMAGADFERGWDEEASESA